MVDTDILMAKASAFQRHFLRIQAKLDILPDNSAENSIDQFLGDADRQDVILFNLQMAIQICLDMAAHLISAQGWGVPGSNTEMLYTLEEKGVIGRQMTEKMAKAVGFRNLIAHEYARLELDRVYTIASNDTNDLKAFVVAILKHYGIG